MRLSEILNESCFGTIATIKDETCLEKLSFFIGSNKAFINNFNHIVLSFNWLETTSPEVILSYKKIWSENVPNVVFLESSTNRGHMFGTIDLEEDILKFVKSNYTDVKFLFKSMDDVIVTNLLLDLDLPEADFYYLPGFSYESIIKANGRDNLYIIYEDFESGYWAPQTTFFIINVNLVDKIYGEDIEDKLNIYLEQKKTYPGIMPWDIPFEIKFDCENHLGRTVKDFDKCPLLSFTPFKNLLQLVEIYKMGDPSHKNIFFSEIGICHYHFHKEGIFHI